jgi:hypothetical protein
MNRWACFALFAILGLMLLLGGLLIPAHLRAVDVAVLQKAGARTPTLVDQGLALAADKQLGTAQLLLQAAEQEHVNGWERLATAVTNLATLHPAWTVWGGGEYHLQVLFATDPGLPKSGSEPFTEWLIRVENATTVVELLRNSARPAVQELLRCRSLTNTVIFDPSGSSAGQAFDAALSIAGLLLEERAMAGGLSNTVYALALQANHGGATQPLEQVLLDLMSLGQRLNWNQLAAFAGRIEDAETLRVLVNLIRRDEGQLSTLFAAVYESRNPAHVARYLTTFSQTGVKDLGDSFRFGAGATRELLQRNQRLYVSSLRQRLAGFAAVQAILDYSAGTCWLSPGFAVAMKWAVLLAGAFLLGVAGHFLWPAVTKLELPLEVRGFHLAREFLFALGCLVMVLLLSEPFLSESSQKLEFPIRLRLPTMAGAVPAGSANLKQSFMNEKSLMTLVLFFALQALLYTASLLKLAEIRRQRVPARMKLKLLDNEDHLFDAGLYLGFVGTIISLILFSLGVIRPSLMAAYSSTSFGIIFVSVFKIFNLRPLRRKLLLEAEAAEVNPGAHGMPRPLASLT